MRQSLTILLLLIGGLGVVQTQGCFAQSPSILWKDAHAIDFSSPEIPQESLQAALQRFIDHYAAQPPRIVLAPTIKGDFSTPQLQASSAQAGFQWILTHYELSCFYKNGGWVVLPQKDLWLQRPYRQLIVSPVSLAQILDNLAQAGQIKITFDRDQAQPLKVQHNLIFPTVKAALEGLVQQFRWFMQYDADFHTLHLMAEEQVATVSLMLENVRQAQVEKFLNETVLLAPEMRRVEVFFPSEQILIAKGPQKRIETIFSAIQKFDQAHRSLAENMESHFESIVLQSKAQEQIKNHLQSIVEHDAGLQEILIRWQAMQGTTGLSQRTVVSFYGNEAKIQKVMQIIHQLDETYSKSQNLTLARVELNYLHVNARKIINDGEAIASEGVAARLQQIFQTWLNGAENQQNQSSGMLQIIPDFVSNALILRGTPEQVEAATKILKIWDRPHPLIKIEAHIFETSDTVSRELGLQFSARGLPEGGAANPESSGLFTAGAILGGEQATKAFQVDALLRFLESEGNGKVLSRPVVVTTNNIEAEMRSGDIINVKVVVDNKPTLKEIKTGVVLRVTPRLIREMKEQSTEYKVQLKVFAESSTPISETVDDIPRINSQSARSEVIVSNGEPFLLGGLIRSNASESERGVPYLKDLPLLGYLFKVGSASSRFNHILVFVTPSIVTPEETQKLPSFPLLENPPFPSQKDSQAPEQP